jgi:hypothetical protein
VSDNRILWGYVKGCAGASTVNDTEQVNEMKKRRTKWAAGWVAALAIGGMFAAQDAQAVILFDFNNGTALDGAGVGATMVATNDVTTDTRTLTTVDIIGADGSKASEGTNHVTQIKSNWDALGINDATSDDDENSFDLSEAWVFKFDGAVELVNLDMSGVNAGGGGIQITLSSSAFDDIVYSADGNGDTVDLGDVLVPARTEITLTTTAVDTDPQWRMPYLTVEPIADSTIAFNFVDGSEFDDPAAIGSTMTTNTLTITTVDLIGQDGSLNSTGATHKLNIFGDLNALAINDGNIGGTEYKEFNPGEGWVMTFDQDVNLVELDMYSQDAGAEMTVSSLAFGDFVLVDGVNDEDIHSFNHTYVAAGTEITFQMTSTTNDADQGMGITSLTVELAENQPAAIETKNGTPYVWLDQFFPGLETAADYLAADNGDSDNDGMTGRDEYIAGTIPTNAASVLEGRDVGIVGGHAVVAWQSVPGKCYGVMAATNLVSGNWTVLANNLTGTVAETSYTSSVAAASSAFYKVGIEKREIYLLIGQSNMAGRGPMEAQDEGVIEGCELFNFDEAWEPATNPLNQYSTVRKDLDVQQLNPGYGFAMRLVELRPEVSVGLVVNAIGGTSIDKWAKTSTEYNYYTEAVARTQAALADGNSRLAGILWHQGESDGNRTSSYMGKLTTLIADLRADFNAPDLPFIAGQVEMDEANYPGDPRAINDVIIELPNVVSNTAVASSEGLTTIDGTHFDSASQRELGKRYAEALLGLQE